MALLAGDAHPRASAWLIDLHASSQHASETWLVSRRNTKLLQSPLLRLAAILLLSVLALHIFLSQRTGAQEQKGIRKAILLPDGKQLPKQVHFYSSCAVDMPLVIKDAPVLDTDSLSELQAALKSCSWIAPLGRRTGRLGTKGVSITLNTAGIDRLYATESLAHLAGFFNANRLATANAWVLTLVAVEGCPGFHADQGIWAIHRDELRARSGGHFEQGSHLLRISPHIVTVLDVYTPTEIVGGATWLWHTNSTSLPSQSTPSAIVPPRANSKFTFRGDAFHGVSGQNSTRLEATISLILEQYKVPTELYAQTEEYKLQRFLTEYRAKRPDRRVYHPVTEEQRRAAARLLKGFRA